jgi:hypothetical protein
MTKIDFKKQYKHLYRPPRDRFTVVDVPPMQFLMVDGTGDPNTAQAYQDAVEALYAVSYKLKFASKRVMERDYVVPPLEGLWWADDMAFFTSQRDKSAWSWTMMIMQPAWITTEMFDTAVETAARGKHLPSLSRVRLETYHEGLSVQILHVGSYDDEAPTLHRLHYDYLPAEGYEPAGKHHEIYLSDPRRVAPEKLKTVLRQPVSRVGAEGQYGGEREG